MRVVAAIVALSLLAGCAGPLTGPQQARPKPPIGPQVTVTLDRRGDAARRFVEEVSARCLLDGVVRGAAMVVDRQSGRVVIVGDHHEILALDLVGGSILSTRVRLSGPAIADPRTRNNVLFHIDRAQRTGDTACPILAA